MGGGKITPVESGEPNFDNSTEIATGESGLLVPAYLGHDTEAARPQFCESGDAGAVEQGVCERPAARNSAIREIVRPPHSAIRPVMGPAGGKSTDSALGFWAQGLVQARASCSLGRVGGFASRSRVLQRGGGAGRSEKQQTLRRAAVLVLLN